MTNAAMPLDIPEGVVKESPSAGTDSPPVEESAIATTPSNEAGKSAAMTSAEALGATPTTTPKPKAKAPADANQRVHQRVSARFPFTLLVKTSDGKEMRCNGYTEDISVGGVSIGLAQPLPLQTVAAIRIDMLIEGRSERIIVMAKCIHQSYSKSLGGFRQGFQFTNLNEQGLEIINRYVRARAPG